MRHRYTPEKERPPPHLNSLLDAEQDAVGAEDVARLAEELDLVQVGRQVVGALVLLPRGAAVLVRVTRAVPSSAPATGRPPATPASALGGPPPTANAP